jgi:type II secretory pathway component PulM
VKISDREKKFVIGGAVLAAAVAVYYFSPLLLPQDFSSTVEQKRALLQKQRETIALEESINARIASARDRMSNDMQRLLPGDTPGAAGANLTKILQGLADASQVELMRKTPQPDQKLPEGLTKVTVQLDMNCDLNKLVRFLVAIENYEKFLKVDELFIQSYRMRNKDEIRNPQIKVSGFITTPAETKVADKGSSK